jgi:dihydroorotate dehydrogenase electron transfer subunit
MIIACGPEVMLFFLLKYCNEADIQCQMSLERYMKCGCGVCGACMINEHRVCKDGPVFTREQINGMSDFGKGRRDASGAFVSFR